MTSDALKAKDDTLRALWHVFSSTLEFHLCGSRFFGDASETSDFDFVLDNKFSAGLREKLHAAGWSQPWAEKANPYQDANTLNLFQLGKVQIIIARSWERRKAARQWITEQGLDRNQTASW